MSSSPPTTLGQYQIIREIARSNDIVYEAYDPLMNRRVAIKELMAPGGSTPAQLEERISRFKREAQAAGSLNHPNIMTVYSFAEENGRHFMAMEYLDGHTLRNELDTKGAIPIDRAIEIAGEVLDGLFHAHTKGVIHRDIKPDNIQILSTSQVKITDFGIARLTFQPNLTMDGQVFGTPSYMSPEQVVGREIDARSDLFSVGVLLYEMIAGRKPFAGDSVVSITYAIMNTTPECPQQCPWNLWQVIERAIDKSPQLRFRDAAEFKEVMLNAVSQPDAPPVHPVNPLSNTGYGFLTPGGQQAQPYPPASLQSYPYDPYANYPPQGAQPYAPPQQGQQVNPQSPYYTQAPIYYPPPPRPLFKPETVRFLKNLAVTTVLVGTLFTLIIVGFVQLSNAIERANAERRDREMEQRLATSDTDLSIEERIRRYEQLRDRLTSKDRRELADRNIAALYEKLGRQSLNKGDVSGAERAFLESTSLDPGNAAHASNLAQLYETQAGVQPTLSAQVDLYREATYNWVRAAETESQPERRAQFGGAAARSAVAFATIAAQSGSGSRTDIREVIYKALGVAPAGSAEEQTLNDLLVRFR
jgi:serine/threonine-protein kinase